MTPHQPAFVEVFEQCSGYRFANATLAEAALTHDSLGAAGRSFERLEFLGDTCLGLAIAHWLYFNTELDEGQMSAWHSTLTCRESQAILIREWKLEAFFRLGGSMSVEQLPDNVYADFFESLVGAVYLDSDNEKTRDWLWRVYAPMLKKVLSGAPSPVNPKSQLQEWTMSKGLSLPVYTIVKKSGLAHEPLYTIRVALGEHGAYMGCGGNIKSAEAEAAGVALRQLGVI